MKSGADSSPVQVFKLQGFMAQERLPVDKTISPEPIFLN